MARNVSLSLVLYSFREIILTCMRFQRWKRTFSDGSYNNRRIGGAKISVPRPFRSPSLSLILLLLRPFGVKTQKSLPKPLLMTIRRYFKITVITQGARRRGVKMPFQPSPSAAGGALGSNNKIGSFKNEATRYAAKEYSFQRGRTTLFLVQIKEISC